MKPVSVFILWFLPFYLKSDSIEYDFLVYLSLEICLLVLKDLVGISHGTFEVSCLSDLIQKCLVPKSVISMY